MKRATFFLSFFLLTFLLVPPSAGADVIFLEEPIVSPDTPENRDYIEAVLQDAAFYIETVYGDELNLIGSIFGPPNPQEFDPPIEDGQAIADFILTVSAVNEPESKVVSLSMVQKSTGRSAEPVTFLGAWEQGTGDDYGRSIYYMWASLFGFAVGQQGEPAEYVDKFALDMIPKQALPVETVQLYPYSLAVGSAGNVVVAGNSLAIELDRSFRIRGYPGKKLVEEGNYTYAYGTGITPGGTIYFRPSTGSDIYAFYPGRERPKRIRTGISGAGPFAVLPDGSSVLVDIAGKRAALFSGRERSDLDIFRGQYSYITALCAGPEGNIWVKDTMDKHIRIYSPGGKRIHSILPLASQQDLSGVRSMAVYENGDFILLSANALMKFTRNGVPVWRLDEIPSPDRVGFAQVMDVGVDSGTGMIYLTDLSGRRIFKLLDRAYSSQREADIALEKQLIEINTVLKDDPYNSGAYAEKAKLYEEAGAFEAAMINWERVLESDPFATEAERRLAALEMQLLKSKVQQLHQETLDLLGTLGVESARESYSETVQLYEQILYRAPGDSAAQQDLNRLEEAFQRAQQTPAQREKPIRIISTQIDRLFPSLLQYYRNHPAGSVTVENTLDTPISTVQAGVFIKNYMDFPSQADPIPAVSPGETTHIALPVRFNRTVFSLEEDLPVQVQITVRYQVEGEQQQVDTYKTATLYRRTALSWDDSRKLAAFVTPHEEVVSGFSHRVVSTVEKAAGFRLSSSFLRAVTICDAVGTYGIEYIEDPSSPITSVLENTQVVDTVRFPRTTLYYQSGDCDDSTALLCSLLEASGISTAIMTSPGHVFCAFDTGEPASNEWQFSSGACETICYDGTLWLPVEATVINRGFFEAWKAASRELRRYEGEEKIEFLPVQEGWEVYPSLPLPQSGLTIVEPAPERVAAQRNASLRELKGSLYSAVVSALEEERSSTSGRERARLENKLGILHARFGEERTAESRFQEAMQIAPQYLSSYLNMANLKLLQEAPRQALEYLEQGEALRPSSVMVNALLAKTYYHIGEQEQAQKHYRLVHEQAPGVAEPLAYIEGAGDAPGDTGRAGDAGSSESLLWSLEAE